MVLKDLPRQHLNISLFNFLDLEMQSEQQFSRILLAQLPAVVELFLHISKSRKTSTLNLDTFFIMFWEQWPASDSFFALKGHKRTAIKADNIRNFIY